MLTDRHLLEFQTRGYTIFESALPAALIGDLRREAKTGVRLARERQRLARERHGPQIQVVQPIADYPEMDPQPFRDYAERRLLRYCRDMPGAVQVRLAPGDFCIYSPCGLHLGNYSPDVRRATLHDGAMNPELRAWWKSAHLAEEERAGKK